MSLVLYSSRHYAWKSLMLSTINTDLTKTGQLNIGKQTVMQLMNVNSTYNSAMVIDGVLWSLGYFVHAIGCVHDILCIGLN